MLPLKLFLFFNLVVFHWRHSPRCLAQAILDRENFTLEELLDEDGVIQECKSMNTRLVNLCAPSALACPARARRMKPRHARIPRLSGRQPATRSRG